LEKLFLPFQVAQNVRVIAAFGEYRGDVFDGKFHFP
jgi:hypothetical protein